MYFRNVNISNKRYDIPDQYERNTGIHSVNNWQHSHGMSSSTHSAAPIHNHGASAMSSIKSFVGNGLPASSAGSINWPNKISEEHWGRNSETNQDRYDRTYNERSNNSSYIDNGSRANTYNMMGSSNSRSIPDRYGNSMQRYDSGKY